MIVAVFSRPAHTFLLTTVVVCSAFVTGCGSDHPSGPTPTPGSNSPATFVVSGVVRDASTNAPIAGARAEIGTGEVAQTTNDSGQFSLANVPAGEVVLRITKEGYVQSEQRLAVTANTNVVTMLSPAASTPSPTFVMSGYIRNQLTGATIANARLDVISGANAGRTAFSDSGGLYRFEQLKAGSMRVRITAPDFNAQEADVSISGDVTTNFQLAPLTPYVYSGYVTDSQGRPVANATVEAGPNHGSTDANGHYEFSSPYSSAPGRVRPPAGYEPKPVRSTDSGFNLNSGGQNITIRRITGVSISPPATLTAGAGRTSFAVQISFDSGQVESPHLDLLMTASSNTAILKADSGNGVFPNPYVEGIAPGTASVVSTYFGVSSPAAQVQVVP
ncbi:MAG TPA: carboxypeptidase regulatory-like domain-containing protein [Vicinamibacterales bacterium]|jgi:hypothetical protein